MMTLPVWHLPQSIVSCWSPHAKARTPSPHQSLVWGPTATGTSGLRSSSASHASSCGMDLSGDRSTTDCSMACPNVCRLGAVAPRPAQPPSQPDPIAGGAMAFAADYDFVGEIGSGNQGTVYQCRDTVTGQTHVAKVVGPKQFRDAKAEGDILARLDHPRCARLVRNYAGDSATLDSVIVMERAAGVPLSLKVPDVSRTCSEVYAACVMRGVMEGLAYLHAAAIVHRDVKPDNIIVEDTIENAMQPCSVTLVDFGLAGALPTPDANTLVRGCGTAFYIAPEVIRCAVRKSGGPYGSQADMWSAGVTAFLILCGYVPFTGSTMQQLFASVEDGIFDFATGVPLSDAAKDFIRRLLVRKPSDRMTAAEALKHPWLNQTP